MAQENVRRSRVAIAGASGFIGAQLIKELSSRYEVVALSRRARPSRDGVSWRACDLYSLLDVESAIQDCDFAVYLVHSMARSARLTQATFSDLDLILADNFARAVEKTKVQHIVYVSGLRPSCPDEDESPHLRSRYEVEATLESYSTPVTTLRAGLVVGPGGSSLQILTRLVSRLPWMITPRWTQSQTQPIALQDLLWSIAEVLQNPAKYVGAFDVGGPDIMSYRDMLERTAQAMKVQRSFFNVSVLTPRLSALWVSTITGSSLQLVSPLVESLKHDMVARPNRLLDRLSQRALSFDEALLQTLAHERAEKPSSPRPSQLREQGLAPTKVPSTARSVQRLHLPPGKNARWAAEEYLNWLDRSPFGIIKTRRHDRRISFYFRFIPRSLLDLRFSPERSSPDRALFYVDGGWLVRPNTSRPARLEFRETKTSFELIAALHDFAPRLPWFIYKYTQALAHLGVMTLFGRHLRRFASRDPKAQSAP